MTMFLAILLTFVIALGVGFFGAQFFVGYMLVASKPYRHAMYSIIRDCQDEDLD